MRTHISLARFERWLWYVFLIILPWQTRIIVWQADSNFSEWRSASVWFTDVVFLALIIIACVRSRGWFVRKMAHEDWLLGFLFAAVILSLSGAISMGTGIAQALRFGWGIIFYLYLRHWAFRRFNPDSSVSAFVIGALSQALLGITQFIYQQDLGLRWIGETLLRTDMHGVAVFYNLAHEKILRAYGTLPHPNVLAAYLAVSIIGLLWLYIRHGEDKNWKIQSIWALAGGILLWGLFVTFSRTTIFAWLGMMAVIYLAAFWPRVSAQWQNIILIRQRLLHAGIFIIAVGLIFFAANFSLVRARMSIAASDEAVTLRVEYVRDALSSGGGRTAHINWTGVGIGNFSTWLAKHDPKLPDYLRQPAHNIYLLSYAEIGIIGTAIWLWWLVLVVRMSWRAHSGQPLLRVGVLSVLCAMLLIGMWDHFFWTLHQGQLLWWLVLALAAG